MIRSYSSNIVRGKRTNQNKADFWLVFSMQDLSPKHVEKVICDGSENTAKSSGIWRMLSVKSELCADERCWLDCLSMRSCLVLAYLCGKCYNLGFNSTNLLLLSLSTCFMGQQQRTILKAVSTQSLGLLPGLTRQWLAHTGCRVLTLSKWCRAKTGWPPLRHCHNGQYSWPTMLNNLLWWPSAEGWDSAHYNL